jgi:hypothetical protein
VNGVVFGTLVVVSGEVAAFTHAHANVLQLLGEFLGGLLQRRHAQDDAAAHLRTCSRWSASPMQRNAWWLTPVCRKACIRQPCSCDG